MPYLSFYLDTIPDLSLHKYAALGESGVEGVLKKTGSFLRQINRKGIMSKVYFHLLYTYDPEGVKGRRLKVYFIASAKEAGSLAHTRELVQNSAISAFYKMICLERAALVHSAGDQEFFRTHLGAETRYDRAGIRDPRKLLSREGTQVTLKIQGETLSVEEDGLLDESGLILNKDTYRFAAALGKRGFSVRPSVILPEDTRDLNYYKVAEWEMNERARLFTMCKLMQGLNERAAFRVDMFSVDYAEGLRNVLPLQELRTRTSAPITKGSSSIGMNKDENAEETLRQYDKLIEDYESSPHFRANILAFSDKADAAELIADAAGSEALEGGSYYTTPVDAKNAGGLPAPAPEGAFSVYWGMNNPVNIAGKGVPENLRFMPTLYLLEEMRPFFSFPALYEGETIEIRKETAPQAKDEDSAGSARKGAGLTVAVDENGYDVSIPITSLTKHAFLAGVPGSGKTNSMLHLATSLWKNHRIPFLIFEPAKKEYRALAWLQGMEALLIFSPSSGTRFPLHINPFEFPRGMSLSEHINNLMAVFDGAFALVPPAPYLIDTCIEAVYREKGWYPDTINEGLLPYPTIAGLYQKLAEEVEKTEYEGDIKGNLKSMLQVRIGSLLRREMGDVFDVPRSTITPEEWLTVPALIELEAMGAGPANFLTLLLSTLIRETLKVAPPARDRELRHVIFFEEAHNLIGPKASEVTGEDADPKLAATAYIVKMLAEVRALKEGIIIADQLPSVMAPEVIKNTNLKIGHRLTAQDDRELLGETMSANPTQLEHMALFGPGEGLIMFEGLLKPFRAKICQWENGAADYTSPSNDELVHLMTGKPGYTKLLDGSAKIAGENFSKRQEELEDAIEGFLADDTKLMERLDEVKNFIVKNHIGDDFYTANSDDPVIHSMQEKARSIRQERQLLSSRLNTLFESIYGLLVKEKGYWQQNPAHKKEVEGLFQRLEETLAFLYEKTTRRYSLCVTRYHDFYNEMSQWEIKKK